MKYIAVACYWAGLVGLGFTQGWTLAILVGLMVFGSAAWNARD